MNEDLYVSVPPLSELHAELSKDLPTWELRADRPSCGSMYLKRRAVILSMPYDRCGACGMAFADPRPRDQPIIDAYGEKSILP